MLKMNYVENLAHELYAAIEGKSAGNQSVVRKVRKHDMNIQIQSNAYFKVLKFVLFLPDDQIIAEHSVQLGKYPFVLNLHYFMNYYAIITMTHYLTIIF